MTTEVKPFLFPSGSAGIVRIEVVGPEPQRYVIGPCGWSRPVRGHLCPLECLEVVVYSGDTSTPEFRVSIGETLVQGCVRFVLVEGLVFVLVVGARVDCLR